LTKVVGYDFIEYVEVWFLVCGAYDVDTAAEDQADEVVAAAELEVVVLSAPHDDGSIPCK